MSSGRAPYPIFVFAAMLPWQFFSSAFSDASNALIGNANLLTKVYFPRIIMPTSAVIVALVVPLVIRAQLVLLVIQDVPVIRV